MNDHDRDRKVVSERKTKTYRSLQSESSKSDGSAVDTVPTAVVVMVRAHPVVSVAEPRSVALSLFDLLAMLEIYFHLEMQNRKLLAKN
jgi:hypothetical protein